MNTIAIDARTISSFAAYALDPVHCESIEAQQLYKLCR
jgi:hypothetical protein